MIKTLEKILVPTFAFLLTACGGGGGGGVRLKTYLLKNYNFFNIFISIL